MSGSSRGTSTPSRWVKPGHCGQGSSTGIWWLEVSMCLNKWINSREAPRVGDVQALGASVQHETQPAVRKSTSTQGVQGEEGGWRNSAAPSAGLCGISHTSSYDLVKPTTCGHFSLPDTASSFHRLKHCQTLQSTQGRAGSWSLPTAAEPRCSFFHARRKDSPGWPKDGMANWTVWPQAGQQGYIPIIWPQQLPSLFLYCWSYEKENTDHCFHGAKQRRSQPKQSKLSAMRTPKAFPSPGTYICSSS